MADDKSWWHMKTRLVCLQLRHKTGITGVIRVRTPWCYYSVLDTARVPEHPPSMVGTRTFIPTDNAMQYAAGCEAVSPDE